MFTWQWGTRIGPNHVLFIGIKYHNNTITQWSALFDIFVVTFLTDSFDIVIKFSLIYSYLNVQLTAGSLLLTWINFNHIMDK